MRRQGRGLPRPSRADRGVFPLFSGSVCPDMNVEIFGKTLWIHGIEGQVHGLTQWTETTTQTTNGTATHLGGGNYVINGPQVHTNTTHHQKFWVVSPGGRERQDLGNYPMRDGQTARLVWVGLEGRQSTGHVLFHNLSTQAGWKTPVGLPAPIRQNGFGRLTRRYLLCILLLGGCAVATSQGPALAPPSTLCVVSILLAIALIPIGFIHLYRMFRRNEQIALGAIEQAVLSNPAFLQSLSA